MRKNFIFILIIILLGFYFTITASNVIKIMTGSSLGTYTEFAKNIQQVCPKIGFKINYLEII